MRIFVADANKDVRLALQILFNQQPSMVVIGISARTDGLVEQLVATKPDVLLVNWDLPGQGLPDSIARLHTLMPRLKLVVLGVRMESGPAALVSGVDAFVDMSAPPHELVELLRTLGGTGQPT